MLDEKAIDGFYKGGIPDFLSEAIADDELRFYEVNVNLFEANAPLQFS